MKIKYLQSSLAISLLFWINTYMNSAYSAEFPYPVVDTGQERCYNATSEIAYPRQGEDFYGQDAQFQGLVPAYKDNGNGTVSDLNTGLMWIQDPGAKKTFAQAVADAKSCKAGGHNDWRLPTIKELYSLIDLRGTDPNPMSRDTSSLHPFIDSKIFKFQYGKEEDGDRIIDSQFATCTVYKGTTMGGNKTMFGLNFADGRIKGYPIDNIPGRGEKKYYVLYVRGNPEYGKNKFVDNGDGIITDQATGLMWSKSDSGKGMNWHDALAWVQKKNAEKYLGHSDWRLPNAKELQSIVDYQRCPDTTDSAAIDPIFSVTSITNAARQKDYPNYWTGTSHCSSKGTSETAVYVSFGRAMGCMHGRWMDVHGAGAQRSDPKSGDPAAYPQGHGPQGDEIRILNFVRCVRGGNPIIKTEGPSLTGISAVPSGQKTHFQRLDKDGDGKISRSEFDGPKDAFNRFDLDRDGFLSEKEMPEGPPQRGFPPQPRQAGQ